TWTTETQRHRGAETTLDAPPRSGDQAGRAPALGVTPSSPCLRASVVDSPHRPQRGEIGQLLARLSSRPLFLSWTAHPSEVTPGAGALLRCRRKEPGFDGTIDDGEHLEALAAGVVVDLDFRVGESAGGRRVVVAALHHALAERLLDGDAVQHPLQHLAA